MQLKPHIPRTGAKIAAWRLVGCAAVLLAPVSCAPDPASELTEALKTAPGIAPRLSVKSTFRACTEHTPLGGTIPRADCPAARQPGEERMRRFGKVLAEAEKQPGSSHVRAVVDLVLDDGTGKSLDRSISSLRELAEKVDRPAPVLADLAAALIVRAERTQAPRDLLEAYEKAELAHRHEPRNLAALYNRALALDRFGLVDEAKRDWYAYLAADTRSEWAVEAQRRKRALDLPSPSALPATDAPLDEYAEYAIAEPHGARELGMNQLLAEWARAAEAGDARHAADRLRIAGVLGEALARRPGGDASLADAVRAIRAVSGNAGATRDLARAHRAYSAGIARLDDGEGDVTRAQFDLAAAEAAAGASPALRGWTRIYIGSLHVGNGNVPEGERILRAVAAADRARYPAMAAMALWSLGNTLNRAERYMDGLEQARESAGLFALAGERENEGAALMIVANTWFALGEPDSGYAEARRALDRLRHYRHSMRLHQQLIAAAQAADDDGLLRSAIRLHDEGVQVAVRSDVHAEMPRLIAHLQHLRLLADSGDLRHVRDTLEVARATKVRRGAFGWQLADLREAEAVASLKYDPHRAIQEFDSVAAYFGRIGLPFRMLRALVGGAMARLAVGDQTGAADRFEIAFRFLEQRRDSIRIEPRRAAVFNAAQGVVNRIVMLELAAGRVAEALDYMDRGRASLASTGPTTAVGMDTGVQAPPGEVAVEYARVADTLIVWTVAGQKVEVFQALVDTVRLARILAELEDQMQAGAGEAAVRPMLSELYQQLVKPVEMRLGAPGTPLVVIADGEIASVPFAALYDAWRGRYLIQDHPLRFAVSLREARRAPAMSPAGGALFVADPVVDPREHPLLDRLSHAREEVRSISGEYPERTVLEGPEATRAALESALASAGMVHFAGHAIFDDARPERSYLVLAPAPGKAGSSKVTAGELARLDLRHVRLVVLAACRTVRSGRSRAGGFTGLSGALLAAGVGGAVGSTWDVDDRFTAALMTGFHPVYRVSRDGPRALQAAQLALLRSGDPTLQTPAAWAGFRYVGR